MGRWIPGYYSVEERRRLFKEESMNIGIMWIVMVPRDYIVLFLVRRRGSRERPSQGFSVDLDSAVENFVLLFA